MKITEPSKPCGRYFGRMQSPLCLGTEYAVLCLDPASRNGNLVVSSICHGRLLSPWFRLRTKDMREDITTWAARGVPGAADSRQTSGSCGRCRGSTENSPLACEGRQSNMSLAGQIPSRGPPNPIFCLTSCGVKRSPRDASPTSECNDSKHTSNHAPRIKQGVKRRQHASQPMHSCWRITPGLLNFAQNQE